MRKLIYLFIILLLFAVQIKAQDLSANVMSSKNTTTALLDSAATYTGTIELMRGYNSVSVSVRATQNGTLKILFGTSSSTLTLASASKVYLFSYTANDSTFARYVPVEAGYFKVIYVNSGDSLTTFRLITMLNKGDVVPRNSDGRVDVAGTVAFTLTQAQIDSLQKARQDGTWNVGITSSTNSYATTFTTAGTTIDSVSFGFTTKVVTFINDGAITDSLFVSPSSSFTSTNKITRLGGEGFTKHWGVTKLYFKVGSTPLASKKIRIEGN